MIFGEVPVEEAVGALSVHSLKAGEIVVRKGHAISAEAAAGLRAAGVAKVVAARLDAGDVGEDEAAARLARAVGGAKIRLDPAFTGRANLFAETAGILVLDRAVIDAVNGIDEAVTLATLPDFKPVVAGEMVATVKIIPYAVAGPVLARAVAAAGEGGTIAVAPYRISRVGVVSTVTPALKSSVIGKTLGALSHRLETAGARIVSDATCRHEAGALRFELERLAASEAELIVVFGASAIADRRDVIPTAIEAAGGQVEHFGMPVDPGNLLLVGRIGDKPVIGAPGCARSPKENGFDWVLQRLLAGLEVRRADITALGVGGLLMEIVSRPQPRSGGEPAPIPDDEEA
ncbi:molybdopterin-binding protein [uncultured Enterovirga sp.]|uniref:molybdopterin-binding protein n=1 Tax=uncultured Enterovirga sp. TaxID=2026352 RepID=UPI0035CC51BF